MRAPQTITRCRRGMVPLQCGQSGSGSANHYSFGLHYCCPFSLNVTFNAESPSLALPLSFSLSLPFSLAHTKASSALSILIQWSCIALWPKYTRAHYCSLGLSTPAPIVVSCGWAISHLIISAITVTIDFSHLYDIKTLGFI